VVMVSGYLWWVLKPLGDSTPTKGNSDDVSRVRVLMTSVFTLPIETTSTLH